MREKFDAVLTCGCPLSLKTEVEELAGSIARRSSPCARTSAPQVIRHDDRP